MERSHNVLCWRQVHSTQVVRIIQSFRKPVGAGPAGYYRSRGTGERGSHDFCTVGLPVRIWCPPLMTRLARRLRAQGSTKDALATSLTALEEIERLPIEPKAGVKTPDQMKVIAMQALLAVRTMGHPTHRARK